MQLALVNGSRVAAAPNARANCPYCGRDMVAKCGDINIWHWAHVSRRNCDPWWENETAWHLEWKRCFPAENCEIIHYAADGEKHIADVKTTGGTVVELQNSPMNLDEMRSREDFYGNMIWIVNGAHFAKSFHILSPVPDPASSLAEELIFFRPPRYSPRRYPTNRALFIRKSHRHDLGDGVTYMITSHVSADPAESFDRFAEAFKEVIAQNSGHYFTQWDRPRQVWLAASKAVYIDFGDESLWQLKKYQQHLCVKKINKTEFIRGLGGSWPIAAI